jgi:hypothetical protein
MIMQGAARFRGTAVDVVAKARVRPFERLLGVRSTGRGRWGPDFYNLRTGTAFDITKAHLVPAHVTRYVTSPAAGRTGFSRLFGLPY